MGALFPRLDCWISGPFPTLFSGKIGAVDNAAEFYGDAQNNQNVIFQVDNWGGTGKEARWGAKKSPLQRGLFCLHAKCARSFQVQSRQDNHLKKIFCASSHRCGLFVVWNNQHFSDDDAQLCTKAKDSAGDGWCIFKKHFSSPYFLPYFASRANPFGPSRQCCLPADTLKSICLHGGNGFGSGYQLYQDFEFSRRNPHQKWESSI